MEPDSEPVVVFRGASLGEARGALELLESHGVPCSVEREAGFGYREHNPIMAEEEFPSFLVLAHARHADYAEQLLSSHGLQSAIDPEVMVCEPKRWVASMQMLMRWVVVLGAVSVVLLVLYLLFHEAYF